MRNNEFMKRSLSTVCRLFKIYVLFLVNIIFKTDTLENKRIMLNNFKESMVFLKSLGLFYFDSQWYKKEYLDKSALKIDPLLHFLTQGAAANLNPNPYFASSWYSEKNPDCANSGLFPLFHYIKYGLQNKNNPHPFFNVEWYLYKYQDVAKLKMDVLLHFLSHGINEGRTPTPYFDAQWYRHKYLKTNQSKLSPLEHYLIIGEKEGNNPHPYIDIEWYLSENPEVAKSNMSPLLHYIEVGIIEDRDPNAYFDAKWYKKEYPDVAQSTLPPLLHYLELGITEQRKPSAFFDVKWYVKEYPDVVSHGIEPLYHYLQHGEEEGRKVFYEPMIPGYSKARNGLPSAFPMQLHQPLALVECLQFDLVLVTYNSSKWIGNCLTSLLMHNSYITITIVDNGSTDDTIKKLEVFQNRFTSFNIQKNKTNLGFGAANNLGARLSKGDYLVFLNIDTESHDPEVFSKLSTIITNSRDDVAAWEFRQLPYEHPKCYDPVSLETNWVSGAAFAIRRDAFISAGGFDEKLFMYCEDVDLSWRLRSQGFRLLYVPSITITHHSYREPGEVKPIAQIYGVKHNYFLRNRFGTQHDRRVGKSLLLKYMDYAKNTLSPEIYEKLINTETESHFFGQSKYKSNEIFAPLFDQFEYEIAREGGFYASEVAKATSKVSVIVRTIGNLHYLEKAIYSVINQTYKNIELVIIEDGSDKAKKLVEQFKDFNIIYKSVEKMGRCNAGNVGLETATGDFVNFLDEDDLFYCDHVETLINAIDSKPEMGAVWSSAFSVKTDINKDSKVYSDKEYTLAHTEEPNSETILHTNFFPIQAVLFRRECYDTLGGFDPEIDLLEDWDLWIKYMKKYEFRRVQKTTSLYRVPFMTENYEERDNLMHEYYGRVQKKHL